MDPRTKSAVRAAVTFRGLSPSENYFRIQVLVSVGVGLGAYVLARSGALSPQVHQSPFVGSGIAGFLFFPFLAIIGLHAILKRRIGALGIFVQGGAVLAALFLVPAVVLGQDTVPENFERSYFLALNTVGFLAIGVVSAWLGRWIGVLTLATVAYTVASGQQDLILWAPILGIFSITHPILQWVVALAITLSGLVARA